jgi:hypothetical protein
MCVPLAVTIWRLDKGGRHGPHVTEPIDAGVQYEFSHQHTDNAKYMNIPKITPGIFRLGDMRANPGKLAGGSKKRWCVWPI